jgi:hypothetical protein
MPPRAEILDERFFRQAIDARVHRLGEDREEPHHGHAGVVPRRGASSRA